jgi:hypothetical protein
LIEPWQKAPLACDHVLIGLRTCCMAETATVLNGKQQGREGHLI